MLNVHLNTISRCKIGMLVCKGHYRWAALRIFANKTLGCHFRLSGGRQKTDREYLVADRGASVLPVAFSLMASFMSAITLLGVIMALLLLS